MIDHIDVTLEFDPSRSSVPAISGSSCSSTSVKERLIGRVFVQPCGAVPAAEPGRIRLVDSDARFPLSVSQVEKCLVELSLFSTSY